LRVEGHNLSVRLQELEIDFPKKMIVMVVSLAVTAAASLLALPYWLPIGLQLFAPFLDRPENVPAHARAEVRWGDDISWSWCTTKGSSAIQWKYWSPERRRLFVTDHGGCADGSRYSVSGYAVAFFIPADSIVDDIRLLRLERSGQVPVCPSISVSELRAASVAIRSMMSGNADDSALNTAADLLQQTPAESIRMNEDASLKQDDGFVECGRVTRWSADA
jgi:hypothetical protein